MNTPYPGFRLPSGSDSLLPFCGEIGASGMKMNMMKAPRRRTEIKICGITRQSDAVAAADLGADAIGLVFYPPSPRAVSIEQARELVSDLPPFLSVVALFVNAEPAYIAQVLGALPIHLLQFHGDETPEACEHWERPYIKAVAVSEQTDLGACSRRYRRARALLLDTPAGAIRGGSGKSFDWGLIPESMARPLVLAGGLNPENVGDAIRKLHPAAVDVSSGVESAKGIKDEKKIAAFVRQVNESET